MNTTHNESSETSASSPPNRSNAAVAVPITPRPWLAERVVAGVGRIPAAVGRQLDKLANMPAPIGPVVRFFSSVKLGLVWLGLTAIYIGLGSGLPQLRSYFDVSSMEYFDAWPMVTLMILLAITLMTVTLRRIPLTLFKLGVWMVHTGIITLLVGCFLYFGLKHEGLVRIFMHQSVSHYYDGAERALYLRVDNGSSDAKRSAIIPLPTLPIFEKRTASNGRPLNIAVTPGVLKRLGIGDSVALRVVGYYPYSELGPVAIPRKPGVPANQPAIQFNLGKGSTITGGKWLFGSSPRGRVMDTDLPYGVEYLYHPSARRIRDISTPLPSYDAVIVKIPKLHLRRVYAVKKGQPIAITGSPYLLVPIGHLDMPMLSPGYRGAHSQAYAFQVQRTDAKGIFNFVRVALFRYPTRTPDFIFNHGHRQLVPDKIDHNLHLRYEDARRDQFWVVEQSDGSLELIHRHAGGPVNIHNVTLGQPIPVKIQAANATIQANFTVINKANVVLRPRLIPKSERRPKIENTMSKSILALAITEGRGKPRIVYLPFQQFGFSGDLPAKEVNIPGMGRVGLVFSQVRRPLPVRIKLLNCQELFYPGGGHFPRDFISTVEMTNLKTGKSERHVIHLNHPAKVMGLSFFQARFGRDQNGVPFTVLGVGNTHGFWALIAGAVLIIFGIAYAFYVKPVLLNIKKHQLKKMADARTSPSA